MSSRACKSFFNAFQHQHLRKLLQLKHVPRARPLHGDLKRLASQHFTSQPLFDKPTSTAEKLTCSWYFLSADAVGMAWGGLAISCSLAVQLLKFLKVSHLRGDSILRGLSACVRVPYS